MRTKVLHKAKLVIKVDSDRIKGIITTVSVFDNRTIAKALRSVDAKTLKIEFEMNGKTAIGKIEPYRLMRVLINNDCFSGYNFCTTKEGDAIIDKLGASTWSRDSEDKKITCKNITRIMYGKRELYVRKEK